MRYSAFISYNRQDRKWADWLHRQIEGYRIPAKLQGHASALGTLSDRLPPVFQDRKELAASADLAQSVKDALSESYSLIVICSPNAAASHWVNEEIRTFIAAGRREHIQCLVVDGEPNASRSTTGNRDDECFPPALFEGGGAEPLAADVRPSGDGKRSATLKLIAGIIGVGYDELRQREAQRRQRRLVLLSAASMVGFLLMSGLALFALMSRSEAIRQRDIARDKRITAERTVDFVKSLFEVSDPSEARGAQISALDILDRGSRQISATLNDEPDVKAELTSTLGEVYLGLGSYRRGDQLVTNSLRIRSSDPVTRARQYIILGESQTRQGNYQNAMEAFAKALPFVDRSSDQSAFRARLLVGRAEAASALERYDEAERDAREALRLDRARDGGRSPSVARDLEALGLNFNFSGNYDAAVKAYRQALAIRLAIQGSDHPKVSEDLNELGSLAYLRGDSASAERYWTRVLHLDEKILSPEHPDVGATLNNIARLMLERRAFGEAKPLLERAIAINLKQRDATHDDLAFTFGNLAIAERGLGQLGLAEITFRKALAAAELHKSRNLAPLQTDLAELLCARRRFADAFALLDRAEPSMRSTYADDPWRMAWVGNTRGWCLVKAGSGAEGRQLLRTTTPVIRKRWSAGSLYGHAAEQRSRAATSR